MTQNRTLKSFVGDETFVVPRYLPPERVENCALLPDRNMLLSRLPKGGTVAEIGTMEGYFAKFIRDIVQPDELHIFDITFDRFDRTSFADDLSSGRVILYQGDSSTEMARLRDGKPGWFDWVYIDGDHTYQGVIRDIEQAKQLIKHDGLIIFNDYTVYSPLERMQYGVARAVNDLIVDEGFELVYFALNVMDYHDVAVRRRR
jgi:predicted O-methyltransferase YrrM